MRQLSTKSIYSSPERMSILLALAVGPATGTEIGDRVIGDSLGGLHLQRSSLYRLLHDLSRKEFIQGEPNYNLTPKGWRTLEYELKNVEQYYRILKIRLSPG